MSVVVLDRRGATGGSRRAATAGAVVVSGVAFAVAFAWAKDEPAMPAARPAPAVPQVAEPSTASVRGAGQLQSVARLPAPPPAPRPRRARRAPRALPPRPVQIVAPPKPAPKPAPAAASPPSYVPPAAPAPAPRPAAAPAPPPPAETFDSSGSFESSG
jgi:hypothetical protein